MKKKLLMLIMAFLLLLNSCYQKKEKNGADIYADSVINMQSRTILQLDTFFQSLYFYDYDVNYFYQKAIQQNEKNIKNLEALGAFKNNSHLYTASFNIYNTIREILKEEGPQLLSLHQSVQGDFNSDYQEQMEKLLKQSVGFVTLRQLEFDSVLTTFLDEYGFDVEMDTNFIAPF